MREIAITVKPTLSCNMKCRHCFNGDNLKKSDLIDIGKVKAIFRLAGFEYDYIKVVFHGGEPTLAGIDFYREIFDYQHSISNEYGVKFRNFFTTNGLLLNEEFIDLLIDHDTLINVSYDGPYHAILREKGSKVLDNIKTIQQKEGRLRCFCTISKGSYEHLDEIYDWFKDNNLDFKTLPIEKAGFAKDDDSLIMDPVDLSQVLIEVYNRWICDKECDIRYYTFEEFSSLRRGKQFKPYWFGRKLAMNPDGKIYPFGRPNDVNYCLGYPEELTSIEDCFKSDQYQRLRDILEDFYNQKCQTCKSLSVCNGVAICMTYMYEEDESILDYSCNQSSILFQSILEVNDKIIEDFKSGKTDKYSDFIKTKFGNEESHM